MKLSPDSIRRQVHASKHLYPVLHGHSFLGRFISISAVALLVAFGFSSRPARMQQTGTLAPVKRVTVHAADRGQPRVNLQDGHELSANFSQNAKAHQRIQQSFSTPQAIASADFDEDGVPDIVCGYAGGKLALYRGNADSINPNSPGAQQRKTQGAFTDEPFLPTIQTLDLPETSELVAGDFNADGHKDILAYAVGGNSFYMLAGNGRGTFLAQQQIKSGGRITAAVTGEIGRADGQSDIAVAITSENGSELLVYEHPEGAFKHAPEIFQLAAPADAIAIGNLDDDFYADIAVASGNQLTIIQGRGQAYPWDLDERFGIKRPNAIVTKRILPFTIAALVAGDFNDVPGDDLAILSDSGTISILEPQRNGKPSNISLQNEARRQAKAISFAPTSTNANRFSMLAESQAINEEAAQRNGLTLVDSRLSPQERREFLNKKADEAAKKLKALSKADLAKLTAEEKARTEGNRRRSKETFLRTISARPSMLANWNLETLVSDARLAHAAIAQGSQKFITARVSDSGRDDLVLIDAVSKQIQVVALTAQPAAAGHSDSQSEDRRPRTELFSLDVESNPIAVLPAHLNADALDDFVVLREGSSTPSVVMTTAALTFTVNTTSDGASNCLQAGQPCTLREAIQLANAGGGTDTIAFDIPGCGPHKIQPLAELPAITQPVTIQGFTQPCYNGTPLIEINGSLLNGQAADGLKIRTSNSYIQGLAINEFPAVTDPQTGSKTGGNAITLESTTNSPNNGNNTVWFNYLGVDPDGSTDRGNSSTGLNVFDSDSNFIYGNIMSGNDGAGLAVTAGDNNIITGNRIGINAAGTAKLPNDQWGIFLTGNNNQLGGDSEGDGNTVSGNGKLRSSDPDEHLCVGPGIAIFALISLDTGELLTNGNVLKGNRIGTNPAGTAPLGNCTAGIQTEPLTATAIGSITKNGRNIVSDNGYDAIHCDGAFFSQPNEGGYCAISGNNIGTDVTGTVAMSNDWRNVPNGLVVLTGVVDVFNNLSFSNVGSPGGATPGGDCAGFCNLISGNESQNQGASGALRRHGFGTVGIFNNFIGTNKSGTAALTNTLGAIDAENNDTTIGGYITSQNLNLGNVISGNTGAAISVGQGLIFFDATFSIEANLIGTDTTGAVAIPNGPFNNGAINILAYPNMTVNIGGTNPFSRNYISGNNMSGIYARGLGGATNIINNYIGYSKFNQPLGNTGHGILLEGSGTTVGGTGLGEQNIIYNNTRAGVAVHDVTDNIFSTYSNTIRGNSIRDNGGLGIDLTSDQFANGDGVTFNDECDADADGGANLLQNFPHLFAPVFNQDGTVTLSGMLRSSAVHHFTIDFYASASGDPTGHGEGESYLGAVEVATDGNGFASFNFTSTAQVSSTAAISSTATDDFGDTSEFSCNAGQTCADSTSQPSRNLTEYLISPQSGCASLIVNVTGDESDANPNDGVCDIDTSNSGLQCTLRAALEVTQKPGYVGSHTINFDIPGVNVHTIAPATPLPAITQRVNIQGASEPGYVNSPIIELNGANMTGDGLVFAPGSDGSVVNGLTINRFSNAAIIFQSNGNSLEASYVGLFADGESFDTNARQQIGVSITGKNNHIGGAVNKNFLTGNKKYQVLITGSNATGNDVFGNEIGLTPGHILVGPYIGVVIQQGASNNIIGGSTPAGLNEIAGQRFNVLIRDNANSNTVSRNIISLSPAYGLVISRASNNIIGGDSSTGTIGSKTNTIIKNDVGIFIGDEELVTSDPGQGVGATTGNKIQGNGIGLSAGTGDGNRIGIIISTANGNTIGGTRGGGGPAPFRNFIGDNKEDGIFLDFNATSNTIENNFIGLNLEGTGAKPNGRGLVVRGKKNTFNLNTISGNSGHGVVFDASPFDPSKYPQENVFTGNRIGTNQAADTAIPNGGDGIFLDGKLNQIGNSPDGNLISGNALSGIEIADTGSENSVVNNFIGVNRGGDEPLGNGQYGLFIRGSANIVKSNTISGNAAGVGIFRTTGSLFPSGNILQKNFIGTNSSGTFAIKNTGPGITVANSANDNIIGGVDTKSNTNVGNVISGNGNTGITVFPGEGMTISPFNNKIQGNFIGTDKTGTIIIKNEQSGILISNARSSLIGGFGEQIPLARNIISGNGTNGVVIQNEASQTRVSGNYIGVASDGVSALGNTNCGVGIATGAFNSTIGGPESNAGNIIAHNGKSGVCMPDAGTGNSVDPNSIFSNALLGIDLGDDEQATPNDAGDEDTGPNNLQNYPEFTSALINQGGDLMIQYEVDSDPANSNYGTSGLHIEFFKADQSLQGQTFIGSTNYTTANYQNGTPGIANFVAGNAALLGVVIGDKLVATATDADNNTSEFTSVKVGIVASPTAAPASISGRIQTSEGQPLAGVTLRLEGAQRATTITDNEGRYSFHGIETANFYVLTPERTNYTFSPSNLSFSLVAERTDDIFTAIPDTAEKGNPLDTSEFFVRQQYLDFLGREPDEGGLGYWASEMRKCGTDQSCLSQRRIGISAAFFIEQEFQQTGFFIYRLYEGALGRQVHYSEFYTDRQQVSGGSMLEANKAAFADAFVRRAEFVQKYGNSSTAESYVDALMQTVQQSSGVNLSAWRSALVDKYKAGRSLSESRSLVLQSAIEDEGFRQAVYNESFVQMQYFGYLHRDPEPGGYLFWLDVLDNREPGNYKGMVCSFITSTEYQQRFGTIVTRSNQECR
jgi:CSLREA domain-containing protein